MCPQRTAAEVIRQRLQRKARQFLIFLIVLVFFVTLPVWVHLLTCDK